MVFPIEFLEDWGILTLPLEENIYLLFLDISYLFAFFKSSCVEFDDDVFIRAFGLISIIGYLAGPYVPTLCIL